MGYINVNPPRSRTLPLALASDVSTVTPSVSADCAKGFGDLFADALGLHTRPNAYNILAVVIFTFFAFSVMVITVERKGRHTGILGGLDAPSSVLAEGMQDSSGVDKITRIDCRCDYSETTFTIRSQGSARVLDLSSTT